MKHEFSEILNCQDAFEFQCPKLWDSMIQTSDLSVRHCETCCQNVHLCLTPEEFIQNGKSGNCIAIPKEILPDNPAGIHVETFAGRPSYEEVKRLEQLKIQCEEWWDNALAGGLQSVSKFNGNKISGLAFSYIKKNDFRRVLTILKLITDTKTILEILLVGGEHLIEQKQVNLAKAFLMKASGFVDIHTHFVWKRRLISSLVEVNQFSEAFEIAQLLKNKLFLQDIGERLREKGNLIEAQRFIDLIYRIDDKNPS